MVEIRILGRVDLTGSSRQGDGAPDARALLRQPKRMALLAYLLLAPEGSPRRRDSILAFLWPELDETRGRAALRQLIYNLRRSLGPDVIVSTGDDDLSLHASHLTSDVRAFDLAVREGRHADALALYGGDLLAGFFVSDVSPEFEQWLEGERDRLRAQATRSAWALVDASAEKRDATAALFWARRALGLLPHDEGALRKFLILCDRVGDRAAALRAYEDFSARMERDLEAEPSPETQRLLGRIRDRSEPRPSGEWVPPAKYATPQAVTSASSPASAAPPTVAPAPLPATPAPVDRAHTRGRRRVVTLWLGLLVVALLALVVAALASNRV